MARQSSPRAWIIASLFASLAGLIDTAVLTAQHYRIADQGLMQKSFCTLSSLIDCDVVLTSTYARIGPILNSEIGFLFYLIVAFLALWALAASQRQQSIFSFILLASTAATAYSVYMASILVSKLQVICLLCIGSYIITLALLVFALRICHVKPWSCISFIGDYFKRSFSPPEDSQLRTNLFLYLLTSGLIFGIGILFFFGINEKAHSSEPEINRSALVKHFYSQEAKKLDVANRPFWGDEKAPITIVDFSDFQCPFCRRAAFSLKPYLGEFRDRVKIVYLNYPLDSSCNPSIKHRAHQQACAAAKAALCAYQKKGNEAFWKIHDLIFENQKRLSNHILTKILAPKIGMTAEEMGHCMISPETEGLLAADIALGNEADVHGTPALFINGRYLRNWLNPKILRTVIDAEWKRVSSSLP